MNNLATCHYSKNTWENNDLLLKDEICILHDQNQATSLSLIEYLSALWHLSLKFQDNETVSGEEFYELLKAGFVPANQKSIEVSVLKPISELEYEGIEELGFKGWQLTIFRQVSNLIEIANTEGFYEGQSTLSGDCWHNFDPYAFLECANAGLVKDQSLDDELPWAFLTRFLLFGQMYE
jgi:hypothetical protein